MLRLTALAGCLMLAFTVFGCAGDPQINGSTDKTADGATGGGDQIAQASDPENTLVIQTKTGDVKVRLRPDLAPQHVERVKKLARENFYDGVVFHRVIPGFMAQTGDPTGTGTGGSKYPDLPAEFSPAPFERGTVGMARSQSPNSANSQFFITFTRTPHLNGQYTVLGEVVEGMQHIDAVKKGSQANNGQVSDPDKMLKVYVLADGS